MGSLDKYRTAARLSGSDDERQSLKASRRSSQLNKENSHREGKHRSLGQGDGLDSPKLEKSRKSNQKKLGNGDGLSSLTESSKGNHFRATQDSPKGLTKELSTSKKRFSQQSSSPRKRKNELSHSSQTLKSLQPSPPRLQLSPSDKKERSKQLLSTSSQSSSSSSDSDSLSDSDGSSRSHRSKPPSRSRLSTSSPKSSLSPGSPPRKNSSKRKQKSPDSELPSPFSSPKRSHQASSLASSDLPKKKLASSLASSDLPKKKLASSLSSTGSSPRPKSPRSSQQSPSKLRKTSSKAEPFTGKLSSHFDTTPYGKLAVIEHSYPVEVQQYLIGPPEIKDDVTASETRGPTLMLAFVAVVWGLGRSVCTSRSYKDFKETKQTEVPIANQEPFLIQYAGNGEKWYLDWSLVTMNEVWCGSAWDYKITSGYETTKDPKPTVLNPNVLKRRTDKLTHFYVTINSPKIWGFVRYKILDKKKNSHDQKSGCFWYQFTGLHTEIIFTIKEIDDEFKDKKKKNFRWRAPDFNISFRFEKFERKHLWYPYVGKEWDENDVTNIPGLPADKIEGMLQDVVAEKLLTERGLKELQRRYSRWLISKMVPHLTEWKTKYDLFLTFVMSVGNGMEESLYAFPPQTFELVKLTTRAAISHAVKALGIKSPLPNIDLDTWKFWTSTTDEESTDDQASSGKQKSPSLQKSSSSKQRSPKRKSPK